VLEGFLTLPKQTFLRPSSVEVEFKLSARNAAAEVILGDDGKNVILSLWPNPVASRNVTRRVELASGVTTKVYVRILGRLSNVGVFWRKTSVHDEHFRDLSLDTFYSNNST
jgi:hypothetical protein